MKEATLRPCFVCGREVECEPGYPEDIRVACRECIDTRLGEAERLAQALRELIVALSAQPSLGPAEDKLLENLRTRSTEWEADDEATVARWVAEDAAHDAARDAKWEADNEG